MAVTLEVSYFNTFWLKRLKNFTQYQERLPDGSIAVESGGTTAGTPDYRNALNPAGTGEGYVNQNVFEDWFVEESRIEGGFNNTSVDFGNKAYIVEEEENQTRRTNALIYSGVYNAKNGINNSNQFPIGEDITRAVDPASGSIQKLHAENTNLIILQERKVNRAPIDKDVIFTQEGQPVTADSTKVIGTPSAFEGNFGISRDPGSFAVYGYNKYFTDKDRSVVMQLGPNGLNPISNYGMIDYFRDKLTQSGEITGGYDVFNKNYTLTLGLDDRGARETVVFDDIINGWVSFMDYTPQLSTSSQGEYYTFKNNAVWLHYTGTEYNKFYGNDVVSKVTFVFNPSPTITKTFKTISYTGSNGWKGTVITNDYTGTDTNPQQPALGNTDYTDRAQAILSYDQGYYSNNNIQYRAGFYRKQNVYYAALKDSSPPRPQQVVIGSIDESGNYVGSSTTGVKGQYLVVTLQQDDLNPNEAVQLFSLGAEYNNR